MEHRIEGTWIPVLVWYQNAEGFTFYDSIPTGSLSIQSGIASGYIRSDFIPFQSSFSDSLGLSGKVELSVERSEVSWNVGNDTVLSRLFALTRTDLVFERFDAPTNQRFRYVLQKK
ncbi:MAG: hypothetical protein ACKO4K_05600 [Flavobacteriales bacterium]|jgi:hypothetical protein